MKERLGFVSNSSSSSFIVIGERPHEDIPSVKLDLDVAKRVIASINVERAEFAEKFGPEDHEPIVWDGKEEVYLTGYLYDGGTYTEPFEHLRHYHYDGGEMGGTPYGGSDDENYVRISEDPQEVLNALEEEEEDDCSCGCGFDDHGVYVRKGDMDPFHYERTFVAAVKQLADNLGIKDYVLEVKHADE